MKRELKVIRFSDWSSTSLSVTKPIPMKRELKEIGEKRFEGKKKRCHKANPDEKGTESLSFDPRRCLLQHRHKANPDEKGTESLADWREGILMSESQSQSR